MSCHSDRAQDPRAADAGASEQEWLRHGHSRLRGVQAVQPPDRTVLRRTGRRQGPPDHRDRFQPRSHRWHLARPRDSSSAQTCVRHALDADRLPSGRSLPSRIHHGYTRTRGRSAGRSRSRGGHPAAPVDLHLPDQGQTDVPQPLAIGAKPRRSGSVVARKRSHGRHRVRDRGSPSGPKSPRGTRANSGGRLSDMAGPDHADANWRPVGQAIESEVSVTRVEPAAYCRTGFAC